CCASGSTLQWVHGRITIGPLAAPFFHGSLRSREYVACDQRAPQERTNGTQSVNNERQNRDDVHGGRPLAPSRHQTGTTGYCPLSNRSSWPELPRGTQAAHDQ